ncbi:MAG: alanine dehydrogenase [Cyclobacteriaceae bacterium]|nr:MAG: alanine dehydrogenase [Cyclobacteriaceae bacterium]
MSNLRIGLIKEGKLPLDRRVALSPVSARYIEQNFNGVKVICQSSSHRAFTDQEYRDEDISVVDDISDCDVLLGVKEVPIEELIPGKTYFFFSHTIKAQEYNRELLKTILDKKITLIDYECLTNSTGNRLLAFGRYAGIVGAYNTIWAFGKRYRLFDVQRAKDCFDLHQLQQQFSQISLPAIKIALTGGGRVAKGAMEVLNGLGIRRVSPNQFVSENYPEPVYTQLNARDYHVHNQGEDFRRSDFFETPENYKSTFLTYAVHADILIAGAYWDPRAPVLFTPRDILGSDFKIKVIGDISCDIEGSIPSTLKATSIEEPLYDYNPSDHKIEPALTDEANITVMSIDNLPGELPRDASFDFGEDLIESVLPSLIDSDSQQILSRATITRDGLLTEHFSYLQEFVDGH